MSVSDDELVVLLPGASIRRPPWPPIELPDFFKML
jgi:hypothetical protein